LVLQIFALKVRIVLHRQFFVWARIRFDQMAAAWAVLAATLLAARVASAAPVVAPAFLWAPKNHGCVTSLRFSFSFLARDLLVLVDMIASW
jgi:hypothetical protein